jgi:hypothetical protein
MLLLWVELNLLGPSVSPTGALFLPAHVTTTTITTYTAMANAISREEERVYCFSLDVF